MSITNHIIEWVDDHQTELLEFASQLIATLSVNPPGDETQMASVISAKMVDLGLGQPQTLAKSKTRPNLILEIEGNSSSGPSLMLNGHMDTKPVGDRDRWNTDPFDPVISNGMLYGLGSADMKSALAAIVYAASSIKAMGIDWGSKLILTFTADEEAAGTFGAEYIAQEAGINADIALIGEPVGIKKDWEYIGLISRGETCYRIKVRGTQMHSSIADLVPSVNANVKMAEVLVRMSQELEFAFEPHPYCPQGVTMGAGVMVSGGVSYGVLPGYAEFSTDVRLLPGMTVEGVRKDVETFLDKLRREDPELEVDVEFEPPPLGYIPPVVVSENEPFIHHLQSAAQKVLGQTPPFGAFPAWTDARFFDSIAGITTIPAFGPGLLTVTHAPNEHLSVESIIQACKMYAIAAMEYLTDGS
ncbi:MAG TPA: M20 family peptidase [Porticoccus sp.]|nr:M20 family peptidase [Porticoccus sp.]